MQINMEFPGWKVTRHVGKWILNSYSPTANFARIGEWASAYPQPCAFYAVTARSAWSYSEKFLKDAIQNKYLKQDSEQSWNVSS